MGADITRLVYQARVSRHNSPRDAEDDALWADFCARVQAIADEPQYERICLMPAAGW